MQEGREEAERKVESSGVNSKVLCAKKKKKSFTAILLEQPWERANKYGYAKCVNEKEV